MILNRLRLENFLCYRETTVDFTGIHVACLAGDNGAGKSALLDAITWALWGKARARRDDELIRAGHEQMMVSCTFGLGDRGLRVTRVRRSGRRRGTTLRFEALDGEDWQKLTDGGVRETQSRINAVLRLDYDTFVNSAFLRQGHADEFTTKTPAERKRVLVEILGLDRWEGYEDRVKERERVLESEAQLLTMRLDEIADELQKRDRYERELEQARQEATALAASVRDREEASREVDRMRTEVRHAETQLTASDERLAHIEDELASLAEEKRQRQSNVERLDDLLASREEIERGYEAYRQAVLDERELGAKLRQSVELDGRRAALEEALRDTRRDLEAQRQVRVERATEMEARLPDGELLARYAEAQAQIAHLEHLTEARGAAESDLSDIASRQAALRVENDGLRLAMDERKEQIEALEQAGAECPLCRQELTDAHRARLLGELQAEGRRYGDVYRSNTREIERLSRHAEALDAQIKQSESLLADLAALRRQEIALAQRIEHSQEVAPRLEEERRRLRELDERLASERFGQAHREELADVLQEASALGYDAEAHEAAQKAVAKGQAFADRKATLESAVERVTEEREALSGLQSRVERWHAERRRVQEEQARLRARIESLEKRLAEADKVERALQAARGAEASARQRVGAAQQRLQACIGLERQRADRLERKALLSHKLGLLGELRKAFGIGGVPAMVIEAAVPDIEREANWLLTRLSSGRLKVHLDTQSETLAGDVQETLAVTVVDEYGSRAYESFSGGERFRIDFALRIALSKLLSRRAGAQLQTLVLDEGFGTQDAEGRERLVEAIRVIQDDFRRVLVVTHIDELREAFPTRIEVSKTPNGSVVSMV